MMLRKRILTGCLLLCCLAGVPVCSAGTPAVCRPHAAYAASYVAAVPTTVVELLIPATAVAFQYIEVNPAPAATNTVAQTSVELARTPTAYAAESFDAGPNFLGSSGQDVNPARSAASLRNVCASCHGAGAQGGVTLWDPQGRLRPRKHGQLLAPAALLQQIWTGRMPKGRTLGPDEKELLTKEILR